jgi:putative DNA primase/helicase
MNFKDKGKIDIKHDGVLSITTGRSRKEKNWYNNQIKWTSLIERLSRTIYTGETFEEYQNLSREEQGNIKDVGGFVGGSLKDGIRSKGTIESRSLLTLDADFAVPGIWDKIEKQFSFSCCMYSTHKHCPAKPRFRIVVPLSRVVSPQEYQTISKRVATDIGTEIFDESTHEPERLMYWPSTSKDGAFEFYYKDGEWLNPDEVLSGVEELNDTKALHEKLISLEDKKNIPKRQENPREKQGLIGVFCRTYSVPQAIDKFLKDIYLPLDEDLRYTYSKGTTTGGLVIYDEGNFAFSHHGTDPAGGRLCNAFDLVRLHKFWELDKESVEGTPVAKLPSYQAMLDFCTLDEGVKKTLSKEMLNNASMDFPAMDEEGKADVDWINHLEIDKKGFFKSTLGNLSLILENDPNLKGKIGLNEFSHRVAIKGDLPWHSLEDKMQGDPWKESDDAFLKHYIEGVYKIMNPNRIYDALLMIQEKNKFHPIRDYLKSLTWDGTERVDKLFVDYLGAKDCAYTRAVTRKSLAAAIARVFKPGIKFDYMLVMVGRQGIGKSHIISLLGQTWYSDSFNTVQGKEAYEQLQDAWIIEMAELSAAKKAEAETVKHFISKREDSYRMAYGKYVTKFPRQCVFFGTTNDNEFLKDKTGNRRFWPVQVGINKPCKNLWRDMTKDEINQIWAEALRIYEAGEKLVLKSEIEVEAAKIQDQHTEESLNTGLISEYLNIPLPEDWGDMDIAQRRSYIQRRDFSKGIKGKTLRERVCSMEVWVELLQGEPKDMTPIKAREINDILRRIDGWQPYIKGTGKLRFGSIYGVQRAFIREDDCAS